MKFEIIIFLILIILIAVLGFLTITVVMIDGISSEFKYSVEVPCYDKYGHEIMDLICSADVNCGIIGKQTLVNGKIYPCNKDDYINILREVKDE